MKASEIRNMSTEDILAQVKEEKAALAKLKFNHSIAGTENPMVIRKKRTTIAKMLTVLQEKKNS